MSNRTANLKEEISKAKQKIIDIFVAQCTQGAQTKNLNDTTVAACGQFLGGLNKSQRGIHGTAAAINVLTCFSDNSEKPIIPKLVKYIEKGQELERGCGGTDDEKCERDSNNVIKISESLIALHSVDVTIVKSNGIVKTLAEKLINGTIDNNGWDYFTDDKNSTKLLPTTFAALALSKVGHKEIANKAIEFIEKTLFKRYIENEPLRQSNSDISINLFCLYVLTYRDMSNLPIKSGKYGLVFQKLWERINKLLNEELEQNIEYYHQGSKTCYVRVPWDLYLLALVSHYDFRWRFSSTNIQNRINNILSRVLNGGFLYPHSGQLVSARTNAILFDILTIIEEKLKHNELFWPGYLWDKTKSIWSLKPVRVIFRGGLIAIAILIIVLWFNSDSGIEDFASEIFGVIWGTFFSLSFIKK